MARPLIARIDRAALAHNLGLARAAAPKAKILAVIKANGYGHGLARVARAFRAADGFAVLSIDEAAELRGEGYTHPIVLLEGFFHPDELPEIARLRLRPVIHRQDQAEILAKARLEHKVDVFLKVDTGMHRLGLAPQRLADALAVLRAAPHVGGITLMTHFARADDDPASVAAQLALFRETTAGLDLPVSLANSAALLRHAETHGDWARPGIMLYGASPFAAQSGADLGLLPAMTLESRLIASQFVRKGEGVGYGAAYVAERDMKVGVVACGYADGYPRHAGTGTPILVAGRETRTLGRVSMDMLFADLSGVPAAHVGSPVTLWGEGLPAERVAAAAGTIAYELFTALAPRVRIEET
ncbi:MAG: alanine racemase [bacterium]|nr:MAG: alanine racemase [bacterium]KAF0149050.1 MAG: alanine racemase [bacterium]KAF0168458.1 MAG: alanine racemase [bacterium]TXT20792.1 MAG: alanine racemase [bacterium]